MADFTDILNAASATRESNLAATSANYQLSNVTAQHNIAANAEVAKAKSRNMVILAIVVLVMVIFFIYMKKRKK